MSGLDVPATLPPILSIRAEDDEDGLDEAPEADNACICGIRNTKLKVITQAFITLNNIKGVTLALHPPQIQLIKYSTLSLDRSKLQKFTGELSWFVIIN